MYGFVFEGCQIFYAKTFIENAEGILFANCNLGRDEGIQINGGGTILYNARMFGSKPNIIITNNKYTKFVDCYVRSGEMITG